MRAITFDAYLAFMNDKPFKRSNTEVRVIKGDETYLYLFGNKIARKQYGAKEIWEVSNGGWNSVSTRERLSAFVHTIRRSQGSIILDEKIKMMDFKWYPIKHHKLWIE